MTDRIPEAAIEAAWRAAETIGVDARERTRRTLEAALPHLLLAERERLRVATEALRRVREMGVAPYRPPDWSWTRMDQRILDVIGEALDRLKGNDA